VSLFTLSFSSLPPSLSPSLPPSLPPSLSQAVSIYRAHPHSCYLYLGSIIVDEFGSDESYQQGLLGMLQAFAEVTFPILAGPAGLINHPDTIDDMFRLCARYMII